MKFWGKAIGFGFLVWLVPFVVAFMVFPIHQSNRPLFESVMAVPICATAVVFGLVYLKDIQKDRIKAGIILGILWFVIPILIDAPLMLLGGPMYMTIAEYMSDIGVTYLCIPLITWGLGLAFSHSAGEKNLAE